MPTFLSEATLPRLVAILLCFFGGLTIVNVATGFLLERALPKRRVCAVPLADGQLRFELIGNLVFVGVTVTTFVVALRANVVRFGPESLLRGAATFLALVWGFQIFYYWLHRAMHHRSLLRFHRWHHRSQTTTALSAQSTSFVEACGWMIGYVGLPLAMSFVVPISFWGWTAYMWFNVSGNVVGHANVELSSPASGTRGMSFFANPFVYHALHHARWTGHYGFQAAFMDRLFGTEWSDWPALFRKILGGHPIETLKERGES